MKQFKKYNEEFLEQVAEEERVQLLDYSINDKLVAFAGLDMNVKDVENREDVVTFDYHEMQKIVENSSSEELKEDFEKLDGDYENMLDNGRDYYGNLPDYDVRFAFKEENDEDEY